MNVPDFTELKQKQRAMWATGDYDVFAEGMRAVADHVVRAARIRAGERVLDIACGTGNTALMARARGAQVTGLDLTPELLQVAKRYIEKFGPTYRTYHGLPPPEASAFRRDLIELYRSYVTPADGKVRWGREYLVTLAMRA